MIRIVCSVVVRLGEWHNSGDSMFSGAENPSAEEVCKYLCCWSGEYWKKVLNHVIPCRNNVCSIHTNLPVVSVSIQSSEGWYVFDYRLYKLKNQKVRKLRYYRANQKEDDVIITILRADPIWSQENLRNPACSVKEHYQVN